MSLLTIRGLSSAVRGSYVRVRGLVRSTSPVDAPLGAGRVLGYDLACSLFFGRPPAYERTERITHWCDAVLEDEGGEIVLALERSRVRAPAGAERTIHDEREVARLSKLLSLPPRARPTQLQVLERSAPHEKVVTVAGILDELEPGSGFRSSARPRLVLRGDVHRPVVIVPS